MIRLRSLFWPAVATLLVVVILCALGVWQVERLAWKEDLIARVNARLTAAPIAAPSPPDWPHLDLAAAEYTPVTVAGTFLNDLEAHVIYTLTEPKGRLGGVGFMVMTPLRTDAGWIVYVNRGFVPREKIDPVTRSGGQIAGQTKVVGLLRRPAGRSWVGPADKAARNEWFSRDPALYAAAAGLPRGDVAPYIIDAAFDPALPGGLPQGGETVVSFPNNHLGYAITWFGLAVAAVGVFMAFAIGRLRRPA